MAVSSRPAREPIFNLPAAVVVAVLGLLGVHAVRVWLLDGEIDVRLLFDTAMIPARWTEAYAGVSPERIAAAIAASGDRIQLELAPYVLGDGGKPWTGISYALLHGSWTHVLMNCLWLAAFGTPVARRCGGVRFFVIFLVTALAGAVAHALLHPYQTIPMIGASAAVSGMMACAAWFMFAPRVWLLEGRPAEVHERPRETLLEIVRNRRVLIFLAVWLATNFFSGILAQPLGVTDASIAWEAHVGGFLAGLLIFPFLDPIDPRAARAPA
jgi:membrane associated rhomboid family serine protease